jgi:hypothetical protein
VATGISTQNGHVGDPGFWGEMAGKLMHPTQILIVEAIWWIEEPLSPTLLQSIYEDRVDLASFSYHCRRLESLEVLEQVGEIPVRGVSEKLFDLAGRSRDVPGGPPAREPQRGLAKAVRLLRESAGLSPAQVAERAGLSVSVLSRIESGADPTWGDMQRVARGLDVSLEVLAEVAEESEQGEGQD